MSETTADHPADSGGGSTDGGDGLDWLDWVDDPLADYARPPLPPVLNPGQVILGRYHLLRPFDRSGQSLVWGAWDAEIRRFVVLKFVHARLRAEARHAANVPGNVIEVYDHNTDVPGNPFLVLEYACGGPLDGRAAEWRADPALLVEKFVPVVRTLARMHYEQNAVHRDLKPSNLLLWAELPPTRADEATPTALPDGAGLAPRELTIKVADWGLATDDGDDEIGYGGTPGFAAPEQWHSPARAPADVFGLAATLYFLLTGAHALEATREFAYKLGSRTAAYAPPRPAHELNRRIDRRLSRIIAACLAAEPGDRYSTEFLADELARWLAGRAIRGDGTVRAAALWARRKWVGVAGVLVCACLGAVAVANQLGAAKADADRAKAEAQAAEDRTRRESAELQITLTELQSKDNLHKAELREAFHTAAQRGDWRTALKLADELIGDADPATARRLRVERLFGYFATNDEARLVRELNALEADPALGLLAARVKLVRGALVVCDVERAAAGRELIRAALAERDALPARERDELFTPADVLYAEALLETRPRPLIAKLREAVARDVLHYPAHAALVVALLASGDAKAAHQQAETLAGLFPDSPVPAFVRAATALVGGDRATMRASVAELGRQIGADTQLFAQFFESFADVLELWNKHASARNGLNPFQLAVLGVKLAKMKALAAAAFRPVAFPVPTVNLFFVWYFELLQEYAETNRALAFDPSLLPALDAAGDRLADFVKDYPEALAHTTLAANRFVGATIAVVADKPDDARARFLKTADAAYRAAEQPTLVPKAPIRYGARFVGVCSDIGILKLTPNASPIHVRRVRDQLPQLLAEGRGEWADHRDDCVEMTIRLLTSSLTPKLKADWQADAPAGREAYRARNRQLYVVGRTLIDTWADEVADRTGRAKRRTADKVAELRALLEGWAEAEGLVPVVAPMPRAK